MDANGTISEANHAEDKTTAEKHTAGTFAPCCILIDVLSPIFPPMS